MCVSQDKCSSIKTPRYLILKTLLKEILFIEREDFTFNYFPIRMKNNEIRFVNIKTQTIFNEPIIKKN